MAIPNEAFKRSPKHQSRMMSIHEWADGTDLAMANSEWADVIVLQRLWVSSSLIGIEYWKTRGKTVIGDIDDGFDLLPSSINSFPYWHHGQIPLMNEKGEKVIGQLIYTPLEQIQWGARLLNGITTPSYILTEDWKEFNPNSYYLPNYMDVERYLSVKREIKEDAFIVLGWGGSYSHTESWSRSGIVPALKRILKKYDNVKLMIAGDPRLADHFPTKQFGMSKIIKVNWTVSTEWPSTLGLFDIGLVPLHGKYDMRRSPLKAIEYCLMGIPFVGSDLDIYDVFTPYVYKVRNQPNAWERGLVHMIENYHEIRKDSMWKEARTLAKSWDVNKNIDSIVKVYQQIQSRVIIKERYT
jgi:glycosyltransferase involved in cell wall biosynthesis